MGSWRALGSAAPRKRLEDVESGRKSNDLTGTIVGDTPSYEPGCVGPEDDWRGNSHGIVVGTIMGTIMGAIMGAVMETIKEQL